jgi:hypothetical protein
MFRCPRNLVLLFTLFCLASVSAPAGAQTDTLAAVDRIKERLRYHYRTSPRFGLLNPNRVQTDVDRYCDGATALCHGGDPDRGFCPINTPCHPTEEFLVDALLEEATAQPSSGYVMGQAVYGLTKFGYDAKVIELLNGCAAEAWWCDALRGYHFYYMSQWAGAEALLRGAMDRAPEEFRCRVGDALWLLGDWDQRRGGIDLLPEAVEEAADWGCEKRLAVSDTLLWLADPLFGDEVNERWTEHVVRGLAAWFSAEINEAGRGSRVPQRYQDHDWAMTIRRGTWDSFEILPGRGGFRFWTSDEWARFHFVPDVDPENLSNPTWNLVGNLLKEGFTPDYGPFLPLPVQLARFRRPGSLKLAAAGSLGGPQLRRVREASARLVLSDGPGGEAIRREQEVRRAHPVFTLEAPARRYLLGFEVTTEIGIGWERRTVIPLSGEGPELSDLLLFDPEQGPEPDSLSKAAAVMFASDSLEGGDPVGVFWETYGAPESTMLDFEITLERDPGGIVDRLRALFSGGSQEGRGRVAWTEEAVGEIHPRSLALDFSNLGPGDYVLVLRAGWNGQNHLERTRRFSLGG